MTVVCVWPAHCSVIRQMIMLMSSLAECEAAKMDAENAMANAQRQAETAAAAA